MINYSLNRILQTKQFWIVVFMMTIITTTDAVQHAVMLSGLSLSKSFGLIHLWQVAWVGHMVTC